MNRSDMRRERESTVWALLLALVLTAGLSACSSESEDPESESETEIVVSVIPATEQTVQQHATYSGTLEAHRVVNAGSNSPARIEEIFVEEGDRVESGDPLFRMEENQLRQARIAHETARREYERLVPLAREGAVTRQQVEMAKSELDQATVNLEVLEENTLFRAPYGGVISERWFEPGELYSATPTESGAPGILQLVQTDPLRLVVQVNESHLRHLQAGDSVRVQLDAWPDREFESRIERIFPTVDPGSRTARVEVQLENRDGDLRPGQFARVSLEISSVQGIVAPRAALLRGTSSDSRDVLFRVNQTGEAIRQVVEVGPKVDDQVIILDGLQEGDLVVVKGKQRLENGMRVETTPFESTRAQSMDSGTDVVAPEGSVQETVSENR